MVATSDGSGPHDERHPFHSAAGRSNGTVTRLVALWRRIDAGIGWMSWACSRVAIAVTLGLAALLVVNIVLRVVGTPILGVVELGGYGMLTLIMLALPYTHRREAHIRIQLLTDRLGDRSRNVVDAFAQGLTAYVAMWIGLMALVSALDGGTLGATGLLDVPQLPFRLLVTAGFCLWGLEGAAGAVRALGRLALPSAQHQSQRPSTGSSRAMGTTGTEE